MRLQRRILQAVKRVPLLHEFVNRLVIDFECSATVPRPRPYSLWSNIPKPPDPLQGPVSDYTSWPALTDKSFSGRHLPPAKPSYSASLPYETPFDYLTNVPGEVTSLFKRSGQMETDRSSVLFMFFAQWFTDSILRVDPDDRRKNTSNHEIDLCQIYGLQESTCHLLRTMSGGLLKSQLIGGEECLDYLYEQNPKGALQVKACYAGLPYVSKLGIIFKGVAEDRQRKAYATGLERGNSSIGYVAISTIFMREHNRLARAIAKHHSDWDDERVFQTARNVNIVILMKLVVEDYINHIAGDDLFLLDTTFAEDRRWYRTNWIAIEFDLLYRWHGLVPDAMMIGGESVVAADFRNNNGLLEGLGVGSVIGAASRQAAGRITLFNSPWFLLGPEYESLHMSREFGLASYNDYRERFGLGRIEKWSDLTKDAKTIAALQKLYKGGVDQLEYVVGIFAEQASGRELFGSLMNAMVAYDAFTQIFSNPLLSRNIFGPATFSKVGMAEILKTRTIQELVDRNSNVRVHASLAVASA